MKETNELGKQDEIIIIIKCSYSFGSVLSRMGENQNLLFASKSNNFFIDDVVHKLKELIFG